MATYHVGAVMIELDKSGMPSGGAWFNLYDEKSGPILRLAFLDVDRARLGAELARELVEIVETIAT